MEELLELKELISKQDIESALVLIEELLEMSKADIINNIRSYAIILLLHLIKQVVENRTTKSWDISIANSSLEIKSLNRRRKSKGNYLNQQELRELLEEAWPQAINLASKEAFEGIYSVNEIAKQISDSGEDVIESALKRILE
ncbi:MAG: DUF29 family protein [Chroococcidiopsidaceae cyanobacterium CP_BM_ER_R8_30]|nr:DUF29 family protein [Chroococcidiopsidaceae cyanobacterium CP_BM_ER_R8_30]